MEYYIDLFIQDTIKKRLSKSTVTAYKRDLIAFFVFLEKNKIEKVERVNKTNVMAYLFELKKAGKSSSTMFRSLSSLRGFFKFLCRKSIITDDPTEDIDVPKNERKIPEILTVEETEKIIDSISTETKKGIRDKAMLELMYATGIRVSEIINLKVEDINLELKFISIKNNNNVRLVPFNESCCNILKLYINEFRTKIKNDNETDILFLNMNGSHLSRQGFWKMVKCYAKYAGISKTITPQTFRHCFAAHLTEYGVDSKDLTQLLGNKDINSVLIYKNSKESKLMDIYRNTHPRK